MKVHGFSVLKNSRGKTKFRQRRHLTSIKEKVIVHSAHCRLVRILGLIQDHSDMVLRDIRVLAKDLGTKPGDSIGTIGLLELSYPLVWKVFFQDQV